MRCLTALLFASVAVACSHEQPPPASSATVVAATDTPSRSTTPVKTDVMRAAEADDRPVRTGTSEPSATGNSNTEARSMVASQPSTQQPSQPDNTRVNERDRSGDTLTPIDQGGSEPDRRMTQQIRQALMNDGGLSFTAKNVKIITLNGKVTLRGTVKSDQERNAVEADARRVAGTAQVDNLLEVKQ